MCQFCDNPTPDLFRLGRQAACPNLKIKSLLPMNRVHFENQFEQLGVKLSEYGGQCYFGESDDCSLVLAPYPAVDVSKAALAIRADGSDRRKVVVDGFLRAAGVQQNRDIAEALEGHEYRGQSGSKTVTIAVLDDEFIVTVAEARST